MNGSRKMRWLALFHGAGCIKYTYMRMKCLLVKSTSFGSIVRDSNTIIVNDGAHPSPVVSSVQYVVYYSFYMQIQTIAFIAKLFLIRSLIVPRWSYSLRKISRSFCWWRYRITPCWKQRLIIVDAQKLLRKARFKARWCKKGCNDATELEIYWIL